MGDDNNTEDNDMIARDIEVNSNILERIQALSKNSKINKYKQAKPFYSQEITTNIKNNGENIEKHNDLNKLNIWRINHRILIFGECWSGPTEKANRRNNTSELVEFLNKTYEGRYMIWSSNGSFKNISCVQKVAKFDFDLTLAHRISSAVKCWLDIGPNNIAVFEMKNNSKDKFKFLIDCIIKHCDFLESPANLNNGNQLGSILELSRENINTTRRYIDYFNSSKSHRMSEIDNPIILKQLIITTVPKIECENMVPGLKIIKKGKEIYRFEENSTISLYKDENYIIFSDIEWNISGDVAIVMFYKIGNSEITIFELLINTSFYRQGLYRFSLNDIESNTNYKLSNDFSIDLVLVECQNRKLNEEKYSKPDFIEGLEVIVQDFDQNCNTEDISGLISQGHSNVTAKFCVLMGYDEIKSANFLKELFSRGYKNLDYDSNPSSVSNVSFNNKEKQGSNEKKQIKVDLDFIPATKKNIDRMSIYTNLDYKIKNLQLIKQNISKNIEVKTAIKKPIPVKKTNKHNEPPPKLIVKKPLHWNTISSITGTIFAELNEITLNINYEAFEKIYCETLNETDEEKHIIYNYKSVIDTKRLFLVSLSLKHLEIKNIKPENIHQILCKINNPLCLQDLLNIKNVYPTTEETIALASFKYDQLDAVEKKMLEYSNLIEAYKVVEILILERQFLEEIFLIEDVLRSFLYIYDRIINSENLRIILKIILEIGNAINYKYSFVRKKCKGIRSSGLEVFMFYKGKNGRSIVPFFLDTIKSNGINLDSFFSEFELVHRLKGEELNKICERVNFFIEMYSGKLEIYNSLNEETQNEYEKFFKFACQKLEELTYFAQECYNKAFIAKARMGENDDISCNDIIINLSNFIDILKKHHNKS